MQPLRAIMTPVLIASAFVLFLSFAIRSSFGVFQIPIAAEMNWFRTEFSLAIALQNLAWGLGTPIFGAIAERLGDRRAIFIAPVQRGSFWQDKLSAAKTNCQRRRGGVNCDRMVRTK